MPKFASNISLENGAIILDWGYLSSHFSQDPILAATITGGEVWEYVLNGVTRYRFVPNPYSYSGDAFYSTYTGGVLSGLIVARG